MTKIQFISDSCFEVDMFTTQVGWFFFLQKLEYINIVVTSECSSLPWFDMSITHKMLQRTSWFCYLSFVGVFSVMTELTHLMCPK